MFLWRNCKSRKASIHIHVVWDWSNDMCASKFYKLIDLFWIFSSSQMHTVIKEILKQLLKTLKNFVLIHSSVSDSRKCRYSAQIQEESCCRAIILRSCRDNHLYLFLHINIFDINSSKSLSWSHCRFIFRLSSHSMFHKSFDVLLDTGMITEFIPQMQVTGIWFTWRPGEKDNRPILKEYYMSSMHSKQCPWIEKYVFNDAFKVLDNKMLISCHGEG